MSNRFSQCVLFSLLAAARSRPMRLQTRRMDEVLPGAYAISSMPGRGGSNIRSWPVLTAT